MNKTSLDKDQCFYWVAQCWGNKEKGNAASAPVTGIETSLFSAPGPSLHPGSALGQEVTRTGLMQGINKKPQQKLFPGKSRKRQGGFEKDIWLACEDGYGKAICCSTGNSRCWFSGILSQRRLAWNSFIVKTPGNDSHSWRTNSQGMVQERVGGGTEAFGRIQQEHYFPMSRRVSTEVHWYISHMLEPELMTVGLKAAVPGKMKQHWQLKVGLKQIKQAGAFVKPIQKQSFPSFGLHLGLRAASRGVRGEDTAPSQSSGEQGMTARAGTEKFLIQCVFSKTFCSGSTKRQGNQAITHKKCIYISHKEFWRIWRLHLQPAPQNALVWTKLVFCDCWGRRIKVFPLSFPSSPIQMWIPPGKQHLPAPSSR